MVIASIIELSEGVKAFAQIAWEGRRMVVAYARVVQAQLMIIIKGETCNLLG